MSDREDFVARIAVALLRGRHRQGRYCDMPVDQKQAVADGIFAEARQIADRVPGLFAVEDVEL